MSSMTYETLRHAVEEAAAIRRVQRLQPTGGPGDKVFPPTYPGDGDNAPPRYVFETRRIAGQDVRCVLLDSVQSQANRLEEALLAALRDGRISMPYIVVDFSGQGFTVGPDTIDVSDLGEITSLDAPHRVFDAIIRDSELDGRPFTETDYYKRLVTAKPTDAMAVFELSPTSLLFGAWNSTGQGGGLGARFARCIVSEIVGVAAADAERKAVRIDPLGIRRDVKVAVRSPLDWRVAKEGEKGSKWEKIKRPSEINHSNIPAPSAPGGVTIDYALHTAVISCAGLRRLRLRNGLVTDEAAGHAVLAALGVVALLEQDACGYALRSRCDLVRCGDAPFEIVRSDGSVEDFEITREEAISLFRQSVDHARKAGFPWGTEPIRLQPQARLVELVAHSRAKALRGEQEAQDGDGGGA